MSVIIEALSWAAAAICTLLGAAFLHTAIRVFRTDPNTYKDVQTLFGEGSLFRRLSNSYAGKLEERDGSARRHLLHKGIAYNRKTKKIEPQGKLSAEALRSIHEPMR